MSWLALDIGGANIKAADGCGWAHAVPFPLWRNPHGLAEALRLLLKAAPEAERLAVTMTGELCDAFRTKAEGVQHILSAAQSVAGPREVWAYLLDGRLASVEMASASPHLAAASNWHALARFAGSFIEGRTGLLIDVGSTTTDIVPLVQGEPRPFGITDSERLLTGELVYTGVGRTPVCAIVRRLPWRGRTCPVAAEVFATSADAYVVLGDLPEQPDADWTADGRPLTREFCVDRLVRMICADLSTASADDAQGFAATIQSAQIAQMREAMRQVCAGMASPPERLVLAGAGEFLAKLAAEGLLDAKILSLGDFLGVNVSACAPAHALAVIAQKSAAEAFFAEV